MEPARIKQCCHCGGLFLYCKRHRRRRYRYCGPACAAAGRQATNRRARRTYRASPEGKAQHADEEQQRRAKQRVAVGDQSGPAQAEVVQCEVRTPAPRPASAEAADLVPFRVEVSPKLARKVRRLRAQRTEVVCVVCGKRGYVADVVVMRPRRGHAP